MFFCDVQNMATYFEYKCHKMRGKVVGEKKILTKIYFNQCGNINFKQLL